MIGMDYSCDKCGGMHELGFDCPGGPLDDFPTLEQHPCMTGDCPHHDLKECRREIRAYVERIMDEKIGLAPRVPWVVQAEREVINAAWGLYASRGSAHDLQNYLIPKLWKAVERLREARDLPIFPNEAVQSERAEMREIIASVLFWHFPSDDRLDWTSAKGCDKVKHRECASEILDRLLPIPAEGPAERSEAGTNPPGNLPVPPAQKGAA